MKRKIILVLILMIVFTNSVFATNTINENEYLEGNIYKKGVGGNLEVNDTIRHINISIDYSIIRGELKSNKDIIKFSAELLKEKDGIYYYNGTLKTKDKEYNCDISKNENGLSILYYNDSKDFVRTIILSNKVNELQHIEKTINSQVVPAIKNKSKDTFKIESKELTSPPINIKGQGDRN